MHTGPASRTRLTWQMEIISSHGGRTDSTDSTHKTNGAILGPKRDLFIRN